MRNSFGHLFKITTFGESHGPGVGVVIDGLPGNFLLDTAIIQSWLYRRRPGQSNLTTSRAESDAFEILSGVEGQRTLGGPVTLFVKNQDKKTEDYQDLSSVYRPGHSDFTYHQKYGVTAKSGGGRSSARETIGRVASGAVAWQLIRSLYPKFDVVAWVSSIGTITTEPISGETLTRDLVDQSPTRCPDPKAAADMERLILSLKNAGDSTGGVISCFIRGLPLGLGEPVFDKIEADLAKAMLSIPATKGFEIGSGFEGTKLKGSEHNDSFTAKNGQVGTKTNHSGGVLGGITTGEPIFFRVAFKPTSTIFLPQDTVDRSGNNTTFTLNQGRHDPCVVPRAVPIVEAMASLVIADHLLKHRAYFSLIDRSSEEL